MEAAFEVPVCALIEISYYSNVSRRQLVSSHALPEISTRK